MPTTTTSIEVTRTSTTQELPLGFIVREPPTTTALKNTGEREWVYVQTEDALVEGTVCGRQAGTATRIVVLAPTSAPADRIVGVAQHAIADNSYGFILRKGIGEVLAGTATIDVDEAISADTTDAGTAGECGAAAAEGYRSFGYAL